MSWAQVPDAPPTPPALAAPLVLAVGPAALLAVRVGAPAWWAAFAVATAVVALVVGRRRPRAWPAVVVAYAAATTLAFGQLHGVAPRLTAATTIGLLLWPVGLGVVAWAPGRTSGGRALRVALVPALAAEIALLAGRNFWIPLALLGLGLATAAAALAVPAAGLAFDRAVVERLPLAPIARLVDRLASGLGAVAAAVAMVPALVIVTIGWAVRRLTRADPLAGPTAEPGSWVVRSGDDPAVDRYFGAAPVIDRSPASARLARAAAGVLPIVLLAAGAAAVVRHDQTDEGAKAPAAPAVASTTSTPADHRPTPTTALPPLDQCQQSPAPPPVADHPDSWPDLLCETQQMGSRAHFYAPGGYRLADYRGTYVNLRDGVRRSWKPPACGCRRLKVWIFGGSAAWGYYQSDLRTLPSAIARAAWRRGIALDVTNYAQPGYTIGQEVRTFISLSTTEPKPDLVLFYDGGNDLILQAQRYFRGSVDDESDVELMEGAQEDLLELGPLNRDLSRITFHQPTLPAEPPAGAIAAAPDAARHAMARYERYAGVATRWGKAIGVPVVVAFQPLADGTDPKTGPAGSFSPAATDLFSSLFDTARRHLPAGVLDESGAFDGVDRPVFFDQFHTSEHGAAIQADRLVATLEDRLRTLGG